MGTLERLGGVIAYRTPVRLCRKREPWGGGLHVQESAEGGERASEREQALSRSEGPF